MDEVFPWSLGLIFPAPQEELGSKPRALLPDFPASIYLICFLPLSLVWKACCVVWTLLGFQLHFHVGFMVVGILLLFLFFMHMCLPAALAVLPNLFPSANTCMFRSFERRLLSLQVSGFVKMLVASRSYLKWWRLALRPLLPVPHDMKMHVELKLHHGAAQVLVITGKS